jgi:hypothetical protein
LSIFHQKYKRHLELCDELISLALQVLPILPLPSKTYGEVITAFFIKALSSFRSVTLLCQEGLGYEAGLLVRSLLNLHFLAKWTEQDQDARAQRFLGWFWKQRIGYKETDGESLSAIEQAEWDKVRGLFEYTDKSGKIRLIQNWYGNGSIRDLAKSLKEDKPPPPGFQTWAELHYVKAYKPLSDMEHSNPIASSAFRNRSKGRYLIEHLSADEAIHEALKCGCQYFYGIFAIWNSHFSVTPQEDIKMVFEIAKEYFQKFEEEESEGKKRLSKGGR